MATHRRQAPKVGHPLRGDIYLVNFAPQSLGNSEDSPGLDRPERLRESIQPVAAITSKFGQPPYPTEVILEPEESGLSLRSAVLLNQVRSVDRKRLGKRMGKADDETMQRVNSALQISFGLD